MKKREGAVLLMENTYRIFKFLIVLAAAVFFGVVIVGFEMKGYEKLFPGDDWAKLIPLAIAIALGVFAHRCKKIGFRKTSFTWVMVVALILYSGFQFSIAWREAQKVDGGKLVESKMADSKASASIADVERAKAEVSAMTAKSDQLVVEYTRLKTRYDNEQAGVAPIRSLEKQIELAEQKFQEEISGVNGKPGEGPRSNSIKAVIATLNTKLAAAKRERAELLANGGISLAEVNSSKALVERQDQRLTEATTHLASLQSLASADNREAHVAAGNQNELNAIFLALAGGHKLRGAGYVMLFGFAMGTLLHSSLALLCSFIEFPRLEFAKKQQVENWDQRGDGFNPEGPGEETKDATTGNVIPLFGGTAIPDKDERSVMIADTCEVGNYKQRMIPMAWSSLEALERRQKVQLLMEEENISRTPDLAEIFEVSLSTIKNDKRVIAKWKAQEQRKAKIMKLYQPQSSKIVDNVKEAA